MINWGLSIIPAYIIGYLFYYITGGIQHLFIRLSGGKSNIDASGNLIIYSDLPFSIITIFSSAIYCIIYGNDFLNETGNYTTFNIITYSGWFISTIFNYYGIMAIHKPKLIPSIIFFILFPVILSSFLIANDLQSTNPSLESVQLLNKQGLEHYSNGEYEQAITSFENSLSLLEKKDADLLITTHQYLAFTYEDLNNPKKAIEYYKASNAYSDKENPEYHYNTGKILLNQNLPKDAIIHFQKALSLNSNHENSLAQLANIYLGDYSKELVEYNKALKINIQHNSIANDYYSNHNLARNYYYLDRYTEAYEIFNKLASEHPDDASTKLYLGFIYYTQGDLPKAKLFLLNAIKIDPSLNYDEVKNIINE